MQSFRLPRVAALTALLLPFSSAPGIAQEAEKSAEGPQTLTLEQASGRGEDSAPSFAARAGSFSWTEDGEHVVLGSGKDAEWLDPVTLEKSKPPAETDSKETPQAESEGPTRKEIAEALQSLEGVDEDLAKKIARARGAKSGDGNVKLMSADAGLYFYGRTDKGKERVGLVSAEEGPFELLSLSADGAQATWVSKGDLFVLDTISGALLEVTDNGGEEFLNGKLDWVYQEEVYGRGNYRAHWLSADGAHVAFLALDEAAVHSFTVVDHVEEDTFRVKPEEVNYPKSGDPNPTVTLGIATTTNGAITWVDLTQYDDGEFLIVRVGWTPDGLCLFMVQDRIQTWCDLNVADLESGEVTTLFRESSESWVDRPSPPRWLADGSFLWTSERTGTKHLYHYAADGELITAVTSGPWNFRRITEFDGSSGTVYFTCTEGGAINTNHYRIQLDGTGFKRLTRGPGSHSIKFNADKTFLIDRVSSLTSPEEVRLCDGEGELIEVLATAEIPAEGQGYTVARWELHEIQARDGTALDVSLLKPVGFDESETYPVWLSTYSGPDAPSVRNRWNGSAWNQFLAENGIIVLQVNVRTASGKGRQAIGQCYKQLGVQELADIEDTVDWLTAHPWADAARVGITGYSYGGFMSAFALVNSDRFALGIAGGGVYDWGMYDTIYTERYMSTPQLNPEGYAATSCLKKAGNLHGFLHMQHGVMDDNVHFQNMLQMVYALQKAGQTNWSMMAYPQNRHGIRDKDQRWHARQLEWNLIQEHLSPRTHSDLVGQDTGGSGSGSSVDTLLGESSGGAR
ncbi:MAG: DPP IV N-terminal domain-containing protein [Planctomycetota bacterium]